MPACDRQGVCALGELCHPFCPPPCVVSCHPRTRPRTLRPRTASIPERLLRNRVTAIVHGIEGREFHQPTTSSPRTGRLGKRIFRHLDGERVNVRGRCGGIVHRAYPVRHVP